jgi:glycerophosphoryl diester phosphodiesterase
MRSSSLFLAALAASRSSAAALPEGEVDSDMLLLERNTPLEAPLPKSNYYIGLDPRPFYLVNNMTDSPLKQKLQSCVNGPFSVNTFTIGHRGGATLQIPEESVQNAMAGARMGAGILECDVSFTADRGLVCRHDLCDLHTTTDILLRPALAAKCTGKFKPANGTTPASATCCTSDITTAEYLTLCSKMDGFNASAKTPQDYQFGTPTWRTSLYDTCATPQTLESYIKLVDSLPGYRNFTPELKTPPAPVPMPFKDVNGQNYTQEQYARDMLDTFIRLKIDPSRVWPQSFNPPDIYQWLKEYPQFGRQAVFLDESGDDPVNYTVAVNALAGIRAKGVNIIAPPINYLLNLTADNKTVVPSRYAIEAKRVGLDIISWTFERSGPLPFVLRDNQYYYSSIAQGMHTDGQVYEVLDVLANQIGIKGLFTDWASTVTFFANCFGLKGPDSSKYATSNSTCSS